MLSRAVLVTFIGFSSLSTFALPHQDELLLQNFVGAPLITKLSAMEKDRKLNANLSTLPWAGYYWPEGFGSIVAPYRDEQFPSSSVRLIGPDSGFHKTLRWLKRKRGEKLSANIYSLSNEEIDELSPAEKYDLLFSDQEYKLTHTLINAITEKANQTRIKPWEGICNGWSLASLSVDRPLKPVLVKSTSGRMIPFYPHDLMALASLLYARSPINDWNTNANGTMEPVWLKFVGRRCDRNGIDGCGDINPATLHLAVVNSIGYQDSGFVMDKHKNETISNVSVLGYSVELYNPSNGDFGSFESSKVKFENGYKVGVVMTLQSREELHPFGLKKEEQPYQNLEKSDQEKYSYTLVLDSSHNIIDGYWSKHGVLSERNRKHPKFPDFLWKLPKDSKAYSGFEGSLNQFEWDVLKGVPANWKESYSSSSLMQQPLGVVLYQLVAESRR